MVAALIGASRLEKNKHYLTDVIAGATLGYIVGQTVLKRRRTNLDSAFQWTPAISVHDGVVAGVVFQWQPTCPDREYLSFRTVAGLGPPRENTNRNR